MRDRQLSHSPSCRGIFFLLLTLSLLAQYDGIYYAEALSKSIKPRTFVYAKNKHNLNGLAGTNRPKLILVGGGPGTGKSTFGMSLALEQGILKCVSTDTVRSVMRSYVSEQISPALHRSSYSHAHSAADDPVENWKETCRVLEHSLEGLVDDAIERRTSLVLEGVSIAPSKTLIDKWKAAGGVACGVLLVVTKEKVHKQLLTKRGMITGNSGKEEKKIQNFDRIRKIQAEMMDLAKKSDWVLIEQKVVEENPLDVIAAKLENDSLELLQHDEERDELLQHDEKRDG